MEKSNLKPGDVKSGKSLIGKIGNNGVVFGYGYKGKRMCEFCACRDKKIPNTNNHICGYYASECINVSRNCTGIKIFISPNQSQNESK